MQAKVCAWGTSAGIRIPKAVLQQVGLQVGDAFDMKVSGNTLLLRPYRQRYRLSDLISQCDLNAPAPDLTEWDNMKPVGQEVL